MYFGRLWPLGERFGLVPGRVRTLVLQSTAGAFASSLQSPLPRRAKGVFRRMYFSEFGRRRQRPGVAMRFGVGHYVRALPVRAPGLLRPCAVLVAPRLSDRDVVPAPETLGSSDLRCVVHPGLPASAADAAVAVHPQLIPGAWCTRPGLFSSPRRD